MKSKTIIPILCITLLLGGCGKKEEIPDTLILVEGGTFQNENSNYINADIHLESFYIGKYEVTQKEWMEVMATNPSQNVGDDLPVDSVSWYDCIEYCNKRSIKEHLEPFYSINDKEIDPTNISEFDDVKWIVNMNPEANGYRLPMEVEWEYAASGGQKSKNYRYSGSNEINDVAWYWKNAGKEELDGDWNWALLENNENTAHNVGSKDMNELEIYDMSGNVREWCFDWYQDEYQDIGNGRVWRGGGIIGDGSCCTITYRSRFEANGIGSDQGLRVCRNK